MTAKVYNGLVRISLVFAWLCLWLVVQLIRIYRIAFNRRRAAKSKPTVLVIGPYQFFENDFPLSDVHDQVVVLRARLSPRS
jgi:hypothetical protein